MISRSQTRQRKAVFINIKYGSDPVDVAGFEYLNTVSSGLLKKSALGVLIKAI